MAPRRQERRKSTQFRMSCPASACYCRDVRHKKQATILPSCLYSTQGIVVPHLLRSFKVISSSHQKQHRKSSSSSYQSPHSLVWGSTDWERERERKAEMRFFVLVFTPSCSTAINAAMSSLRIKTTRNVGASHGKNSYRNCKY